jgi:hypothetical protein
VSYKQVSEAAWELQIAFIKPPEDDTQSPEAICSSHAALQQLLALQQEGLGNSVKILKDFARGEIKLN